MANSLKFVRRMFRVKHQLDRKAPSVRLDISLVGYVGTGIVSINGSPYKADDIPGHPAAGARWVAQGVEEFYLEFEKARRQHARNKAA